MTNKIETGGVRAALIAVVTDGNEDAARVSLAELARLLDTAGGEAVFTMIQNKEAPDVRTYIGSGKVAELAYYCAQNEVTLAVFDDELSPSQIRNLEEALGEVRVIDRSMLILDIFALHADSGEGKLQVELAQLKYTAPRLLGKGSELEAASAPEVPVNPNWKPTGGICNGGCTRWRRNCARLPKTGRPSAAHAIAPGLPRWRLWDTPMQENPPCSTP